ELSWAGEARLLANWMKSYTERFLSRRDWNANERSSDRRAAAAIIGQLRTRREAERPAKPAAG
ncbi:MAG TPA: hypothetical protein VG125_09765, partial [Pirellulales bacterium]|nr:hypothetical protein [Pirellulales bacterium]